MPRCEKTRGTQWFKKIREIVSKFEFFWFKLTFFQLKMASTQWCKERFSRRIGVEFWGVKSQNLTKSHLKSVDFAKVRSSLVIEAVQNGIWSILGNKKVQKNSIFSKKKILDRVPPMKTVILGRKTPKKFPRPRTDAGPKGGNKRQNVAFGW